MDEQEPVLVKAAIALAATLAGVRPDQASVVLEQYRQAVHDLHIDPEWTAVMHMSGPDLGMASYSAEGTSVMRVVESWKERGNWTSGESYQLHGAAYDSYSEAREIELGQTTRFKPLAIKRLGEG